MKFFFSIMLLLAQPALSQIINIDQARAKKTVLAIPPLLFVGNPSSYPNHASIGSELYRVIQNNLTFSSFFSFLPQSSFLEDSKLGVKPVPEPNGFKFESWKQIGAEFLIKGQFSIAGSTVNLEVFTYNVSTQKLVFGKKYSGSADQARKLAHTFCNDFLKELTGKEGVFLSKVVVSSNRGGSKWKEIYVMDWDGANVEKITNHKSIAISPAWSPDAQKVAYTAFVQRAKSKTRNADLFVFDINKGTRWLVSYKPGINSGANFDPSGKYIYLTSSQSGNPDIFKITLDGTQVQKLTNGPTGAMNVEPAVSPDGSKLAFSSDRHGQPMVYVMNIDGSNIKRITFAGRYNATPSWSPDSKKLAFAGWENDHFDIFTVNADGTDMVRITSSRKPNGKWANNEDPSFSADGRLLMYTSNRTGTYQIYISNLDGSEERRVTNDNFDYYKPRWSGNL
jgi:TolB protein